MCETRIQSSPNVQSNPDEHVLPEDHERVVQAVHAQMATLFQRPLAAGLHLVATPIGNLGDITLRAITTIAMAELVFCEDKRVSRALLERFAVRRALSVYQEHNAESVRPTILDAISRGRAVALISDAGMPAISDPGFKLVREVVAADGAVFVVPGASALTASLAVSGIETDAFLFAGFLPQKAAARRAKLAKLKSVQQTLIFYESPHRIEQALQDLSATFGEERRAAITRELTKRFEEVRRGTLSDLCRWAAETPPRGEIALVVRGASGAPAIDDAEVLAHYRAALENMKPGAASRFVAEALGISRARVYELGLSVKRGET